MKTTLSILVGLLCFAPASQADVFVYKNKIVYTITGGFNTTKNVAAGWTVIDDAGNITQVLAYTGIRQYAIVPMQSHEYETTIGAGGKQYSFIVQHDVWTDGSGLTHIDTGGAIGQDFVVIVNGNQWSVPKSFKWGGRSMYPVDTSGTMKYEESAGTFSFDKKMTDTCNAAGDNLGTCVQRLVDSLVASGYQQL